MKHRIFAFQKRLKGRTAGLKFTFRPFWPLLPRAKARFLAAIARLRTARKAFTSVLQRILSISANALRAFVPRIRTLLKAVGAAISRGFSALCSVVKGLRPARISNHRQSSRILQGLFARRGDVAYYALLILAVGTLTWGAAKYRSDRSIPAPRGGVRSIEAASEVQQPAATAAPEETALGSKPVSGEILQTFSPNELVWSEELGQWQTHPGVDLAGCAGEAVQAIVAGRVTQIYDDPLYGGTVVVDCGERGLLCYSSLSTLRLVKKDQLLDAGDILGAVGSCPAEDSLGEHLHLEWYLNGEAADPSELWTE